MIQELSKQALTSSLSSSSSSERLGARRGDLECESNICNVGSDPPLTRDVDGQVFDAGLLNWLRIEPHQRHYLLWHTHLDRKP